MMTYDTLPQRGRIVIRRNQATTATITLRMGVSYQIGTRLLPESTTATMMLPSIFTDANGRTQRLPVNERATAVPINSLFGDLNPIFVVNGVAAGQVGTTYTRTYQVSFPPSVTEASIVCTARWSDQSFPSNPGTQNPRTMFVALLPGEGYTIPPASSFQDFTRITLEDPVNVSPIILPQGRNFCQRYSTLIAPIENFVAIESSFLDSTGLPQSYFYDDNYDRLFYSVTTSNTNALTSRINLSDFRNFGLPSLYFSAQPNVRSTQVSITITATDNRSILPATLECLAVNIITNVRLSADVPSGIFLSPNPADAQANIRFTLTSASNVRFAIYSMLGDLLKSYDLGIRQAGEQQFAFDVQTLASGIYPVKMFIGNEVHSAMVRVIR